MFGELDWRIHWPLTRLPWRRALALLLLMSSVALLLLFFALSSRGAFWVGWARARSKWEAGQQMGPDSSGPPAKRRRE